MSTDFAPLIKRSLEEGLELRRATFQQLAKIEECGVQLVECLGRGGKVFFAGNGGSAADAQHLAAELVGRFESDNCLPALALTTDSSVLTALANDFGFEFVFARQLKALARSGDCLVAISTSGNSPSILRAVECAALIGVTVVGLAGGKGGRLAKLTPHCLVVPSERTCRVQEIHISVGHIWCEMVEEARRRGHIPSP